MASEQLKQKGLGWPGLGRASPRAGEALARKPESRGPRAPRVAAAFSLSVDIPVRFSARLFLAFLPHRAAGAGLGMASLADTGPASLAEAPGAPGSSSQCRGASDRLWVGCVPAVLWQGLGSSVHAALVLTPCAEGGGGGCVLTEAGRGGTGTSKSTYSRVLCHCVCTMFSCFCLFP